MLTLIAVCTPYLLIFMVSVWRSLFGNIPFPSVFSIITVCVDGCWNFEWVYFNHDFNFTKFSWYTLNQRATSWSIIFLFVKKLKPMLTKNTFYQEIQLFKTFLSLVYFGLEVTVILNKGYLSYDFWLIKIPLKEKNIQTLKILTI